VRCGSRSKDARAVWKDPSPQSAIQPPALDDQCSAPSASHVQDPTLIATVIRTSIGIGIGIGTVASSTTQILPDGASRRVLDDWASTMASAQTAPHTLPRTNGSGNAFYANPTSPGAPLPRSSLSSFPSSSRSASEMSQASRPSRSPQPLPGIASETDRTSNPSSKSKTASTGTAVSSQHSSLSASGARRYAPNSRQQRRLRSQYPRGSTEKHVEYILVASFDIDRGPVMEHQYPVAITGDEHMLAELMLPDQAHVRNQDWTIFFLHKDTSQEEDDAERQAKDERRNRRRRKRDRAKGVIHESDDEDEEDGDLDEEDWDDDESTDSEPEGGEGPPLIYVLNLVNTKQDKTVKRGAVVKAMAICTRHPFLHIYKASMRCYSSVWKPAC